MDIFEQEKPSAGTKVYTVTEVTRDIKHVLEDMFPGVWVEGEISNYTMSSAGHAYFSLKDKNSILNSVLFKGNSINTGFVPEDGLHVLCYGRVSLYEKRGQYQLYVSRIEPQGRGALQLAFEQLKKKLFNEGLFDARHKKPLPFLPARVGVVTSASGAAIRDILKVAGRRFPNVDITIYPVTVQGEAAKDEIARAIRDFNLYNEHIRETGGEDPQVEVLIVGRGGGSLEDLWAFNEEVVARAIFDSKIPVVSAVGHEIDYTISDFVADLRAPTPSAAAEIVLPLKEELADRLRRYRERLYSNMKNKITVLEREIQTLRDSYVLREPINVFIHLGQRVDDLVRSGETKMAHFLEIKQRELGSFAGKLEALSPLAVLKRGYSITFKGGEIVKSAALLERGDIIETRFAEDRVISRVESSAEKSR
ncbi:MAG: exodeoxyribonuclease VII large subunit [Candidatus Omnitrophota bacterium]